MTELPRPLRRASVAVAAGRPARAPGAAVNEPLAMSSTFHAGGDLGYVRDGSASTVAFEAALGALDGGEAIMFASGTAAAAAVLETLPTGSRVVAPESMYWGSLDLLRHAEQRGRLEIVPVDQTDIDRVQAAVVGAALVWIETPSNPLIDISDLPVICAAARAAGAVTCVDATFATPLLQRPLHQGADIVLHSVTKYIGGHSDVLAGVLVTSPERAAGLRTVRHQFGASPGALEAYLALRGLRTLDVRMRRAEQNAMTLATRLDGHPAVRRVRYPGLATDPNFERATRLMDGPGAMIAFEMGNAAAADSVCDSVRLISAATSLGGVESLIERRAKYDGERLMGTPEGLIRFSVGIEDVEDLWEDLLHALNRSSAQTS